MASNKNKVHVGASTSTGVRRDERESEENDQQWDDIDCCLLCGKFMEESKSCVVKEGGISYMIQASLKRKDNKHLQLKELTQITVHKTCQCMYTRATNIKIAIKELNEKSLKQSRANNRQRHSAFSSNCFFCSVSLHHARLLRKKVLKQFTIDNLLEQLEVYPKTEINKIILSRLEPLRCQKDDYYVDNTVGYHAECLSKFYLYSPINVKGKPINEEMNDLLSFVITNILENSDECQFSLKDIVDKYKAINKHVEIHMYFGRLEKQLKEHFGDEIGIYSFMNDRLICYKRTLGFHLEDNWYSNKKDNEKQEKLRLVEMAANIILQDIRSIRFDLNNYNSPSEFLNNATADVPETLQLFLNTLIKTHKKIPENGSSSKWDNKISTAAHVLMSSVRPRSFCSPILLGLSSMIHSKFGERGLIDCLYNLGLCESYSETVRFENSVIDNPEDFGIIRDTYVQSVYDNVDHNTATIDGKNTFHCMGGIICVTPRSSIKRCESIPRLKENLPKPYISSTSGFLPLADFKNKKPFKLDSVIIRDWKEIDSVDFSIKIEPIDVLYFFGKHTAAETTPNWHGFMNKFHKFNTDYSVTRIIALPFINAPPSDHTTILTALIDARSRANANDQKHCFVTFDLPLFMKSSEIIASIDPANDPHNLRSIVVRLGGFHLLMSFNRGIGNIMNGSGLKEAFSTIYAELSADEALRGHAFSRSVRGHLLVQAALATIILKKMDFTEDEIAYLNKGLKKVGERHFEDYVAEPLMTQIQEKFIAATKKLESNGPTSALWIQYFKLICLILRYIDAERSGNLNLHLETVLMMIPILFSSGQHLYAKACLLYLQNMIKLKEQMNFIEYDKFRHQGFFTIRRSSRFWSGIWTDMSIEQVLMRAMKCTAGLTHDCGLTENAIAMKILSRVAVLEVSDAMEIFSNVKFTSSEQHVDDRVSRMIRDADDLSKLQRFFETYDPFPETDNIVGIYSGEVGDLSTVNCHKAFETGKILMQQASGKKFTEVEYERSSKLVHLPATNSVMKNTADEEVYVSPLFIFQRLLNIKKEGEMKEYGSSYELSPVPLSLFNENGMRKTEKATFFSNFNSTCEIEAANITYVVDGDYFLHSVVWQSNLIVEKIVKSYVSYAKKHYTSNSLFIFYGYPEDDTFSVKSVERSSRKLQNTGREIAFDKNTKLTVNQVQFLNNEKNKSRLINMICIALNESGFRTKIAPEDVHRLIIVNAIENARLDSDATIVIVGQDIDLLVIFTQLAENMKNIYFCRICEGSPNEFYDCDSFKYPHLKKMVAFLHAFCGCDTVSCFYNIGKNKLIDSIPHNTLLELSDIFYNSDASCDKISDNAYQLICRMYSTKAEQILMEKSTSFTLNDLRYLHFNKAEIKSDFALEALPPTEGAAKQHAFRVFYQVQCWLGNENIQATDWGWQIKNNQLVPIGSKDPCIPKQLLDEISCSCGKKGCIDGSCTCKNHGLPCSNLCGNCLEDSCYNLVARNKSIESEPESECEDEDIDLELDDMNDVAKEIDIFAPARKKRKIL